jgi:hypothetical protein
MSSFSSLLASANEMQYSGGLDSNEHVTLHRTLDELGSIHPTQDSQDMSTSTPHQREANQLLAKFFDPQAFEASVMDLEFSRTNNAPYTQEGQAMLGKGDDLYSYLRHHHDTIVQTAITDTQATTLRHATTLMQKRRVEVSVSSFLGKNINNIYILASLPHPTLRTLSHPSRTGPWKKCAFSMTLPAAVLESGCPPMPPRTLQPSATPPPSPPLSLPTLQLRGLVIPTTTTTATTITARTTP